MPDDATLSATYVCCGFRSCIVEAQSINQSINQSIFKVA